MAHVKFPKDDYVEDFESDVRCSRCGLFADPKHDIDGNFLGVVCEGPCQRGKSCFHLSMQPQQIEQMLELLKDVEDVEIVTIGATSLIVAASDKSSIPTDFKFGIISLARK